MGVDLSLVTGIMVGLELVSDEDYDYLFFDLFFLRITFFRDRQS